MININGKYTKCKRDDCKKFASFNLPKENKGMYCSEHKLEGMIDVHHKKCAHDGCLKIPSFNSVTETTALYCIEHKLDGMIRVTSKKCQSDKCKKDAIYGLQNKKAQFCFNHKQDGMVNIHLESKCNVLECEKEFDLIVGGIKYCLEHCPDKKYEVIIKKKCMYCDIEGDSKYTCNECKKIKNKKEWSIVRYLRKHIDTKFEYNTNKMLNGCSKKRPDIYFELAKHCVIVEIDENQHKSYEDNCECARINEIVNGIGGKSVIIVRYNPDKIHNRKKEVNIDKTDRLQTLVYTIKDELTKDYDGFIVKTVQLFYDDDYKEYQKIKTEDITNIVTI